jgi:hypothetical protein
MSEAMITRRGLIDMQVCVPSEWTDAQAEDFANRANPTGIRSPWRLRAADDPAQAGAQIRVTCAECADNVHIMMSC